MTTVRSVRDQGLDKFYTNLDVALACIHKTNEYFPLDNFDTIIEPSAGGGSFSNQILHNNVIAMDIMPEQNNINIMKQDFLNYYPIRSQNTYMLTIGNPPVGKNSSLP